MRPKIVLKYCISHTSEEDNVNDSVHVEQSEDELAENPNDDADLNSNVTGNFNSLKTLKHFIDICSKSLDCLSDEAGDQEDIPIPNEKKSHKRKPWNKPVTNVPNFKWKIHKNDQGDSPRY